MKRVVTPVVSLLLCLPLLVSCAADGAARKEGPVVAAVPAGVRYPAVIAVLPFGNETDDVAVAGQVRRSFYNHFSSKPFRDIEINVLDPKLALLEKERGKDFAEIPPAEIAEALGAEGLVYGRVTDYQRVYAVAYSQMGVEAEVWMVDAATGKELWRIKEAVRYHEGGVPLSPVGAVMTAVTTAMNIRDIQRTRVINELGWKLNEKVPVPEGFEGEREPVIRNVMTNAGEGPFGKGKVFKVAMEGEPGLVGIFEIGGFRKALAMREVSPGEYLGEYMVVPGDEARDAPVVVYLGRPGGAQARWFDITGLVTIDTEPPPRVGGLTGVAFTDRLELAWKGVDASDLKGYRVMRSIKPLSGYEEVAFVEETRFADRSVQAATPYYYRVTAVDAAGNEGEPSESRRLVLRHGEPVAVGGVIAEDRTFYAGDYVLKGEVTVAEGVSVELEPGVRFFFEPGASLVVLGALRAVGTADSLVEFLPGRAVEADGGRWKGIFFDSASGRLERARISGAAMGVVVTRSAVKIVSAVMEGNVTALAASGLPSPEVTGSTVWHNEAGLRLVETRAVVRGNDITQNGVGIEAVDSSPVIEGNNIYDNDVNVRARGAALSLDGNYLGSVKVQQMRIEGEAAAAKVLDGPAPEGRPVDAVEDPYASLSDEERRELHTRLVIEGGRYFRKRNFGKAADSFEKALMIEPSEAIYYYLGLSYQEMDDNERALAYLTEGVEKYPNDSGLAKARALLLYQLERLDEARRALAEALRLNPGDRQIKFILERLER
ncbi:MAG TPA: hypothetical protein ENJ37_06570 [Deltaproteobacteria bacterium]|nr:hypothetical protein [Deltaproteobacteria bacterium]